MHKFFVSCLPLFLLSDLSFLTIFFNHCELVKKSVGLVLSIKLSSRAVLFKSEIKC